MRKFWQVVGIATLAILVAVPAMAIDFKMSGSYRVRMFMADGIGGETNNTATSPFSKSVRSQRNQNDIRFRPYFIVSDDNGNIQSHLRFEIGDVTFGDSSVGTSGRGSGGTPPGDGVNVETKWAFIDFQLPFGIPARLRGGAQGFYLPKGMILDDDAMGLRLYGKKGIFGYEAFWYQIDERDQGGQIPAAQVGFPGAAAVGPANDDIHLYAGKLDFAFAKAINPYIYGVFRHGSQVDAVDVGGNNNSSGSDGYWFGIGATGDLGFLKYDADFVYGYDEPYVRQAPVAGNIQTREGWSIDAGIEAPIGPVALGLRFGYTTGDKSDTAGENEDFPAIMYAVGQPNPANQNMASYTPKGAQIFWNSNGSAYWRGGYGTQIANNWFVGGYVQYYPVKALLTRLTYYYVGAAKAETNNFTGKSSIGQEINFVSEYTLYTGFKVWAVAGIFITPSTGQNAAGNVALKDATLFSIGMQHDF